MASIHKRPDSKYYHGAWRATDGRLILRSTKQTDRKKALEFARECERAEKMAGADVLTETQAREIVGDIMKRSGSDESLRCPSARKFFFDWLDGKTAILSPSTKSHYAKSIKEFIEHLGVRADKPLSTLNAQQLQSFIASRSKLGLSPKTVRLDCKTLSAALNKARKQGLIATNPAESVELAASKPLERGTFTPVEVKMLLDAAEGEWKTLIRLAYFTGARLTDCARMTWDAVDMAKGVLTYTQRKTGVEVIVPIHPELEVHLSKLASSDKPEKFIIPGLSDMPTGGRTGLSESFKTIMHKAGVDSKRVERDVGVRTLCRRSFHALRHSFASELANAGVPPELRMLLTGHKSERIHAGYSHHELETLRAAIGKLPTL